MEYIQYWHQKGGLMISHLTLPRLGQAYNYASIKQLHFGWGGKTKNNTPRPLPTPSDFIVNINSTDVRISASGKVSFHPAFLNLLYTTVFRDNLNTAGFVVLTGLKETTQNNLQSMRKIQLALGQALTLKRADALELNQQFKFTPKYMGRSNKIKLNPTHCDTKHQDSLALMLYEPAQDVIGYPYIADLSQYAKDHNVDAEKLMITGQPLKSHYGNQLNPEFDKDVQSNYAMDLDILDQLEYPLVILNDSISKKNMGHVHGVRHLQITGKNPDRSFNHLVIDMDRKNARLKNPTYFIKGIPETKQTALTEANALASYINEGTILYRSDSNR